MLSIQEISMILFRFLQANYNQISVDEPMNKKFKLLLKSFWKFLRRCVWKFDQEVNCLFANRFKTNQFDIQLPLPISQRIFNRIHFNSGFQLFLNCHSKIKFMNDVVSIAVVDKKNRIHNFSSQVSCYEVLRVNSLFFYNSNCTITQGWKIVISFYLTDHYIKNKYNFSKYSLIYSCLNSI